MARIIRPHPEMRRNYYWSERCVGGAARRSAERACSTTVPSRFGCESLVGGREGRAGDRRRPQHAGRGVGVRAQPELVAFTRCAVDIRNVGRGRPRARTA
jgi:hypothetical protein